MSSVITTIETDAKAVVNTVSTDLKSEVLRLTGLLEKAKTTITTQAQTIAGHVSAAVVANSVSSAAAATLKAASDDFEKVLSAVAPTVAAAVVVPLAIQTVVPSATANLVLTPPVAPVAQTVAPAANAVHVALDAAIHAGPVAPTLSNLNALEAAYAKLMTNAGTSNSAAAPLPAHIAAIVTAAQTTGSGVLHRIEDDVNVAATDVKGEAEKVASEVKTVVEDVVEGKATIGPLHI